jgi:hypothetical protein
MTLAQLDERVTAIERELAELKATLPPTKRMIAPSDGAPKLEEEELIPGAEYPLVPSVPPKVVVRLKGRIRSIRRGPQDLGLSDADWASLCLEEGDE